jgi:hypothetical protein
MKEIHDEIFSSLEAAMTAANIYTTNDMWKSKGK